MGEDAAPVGLHERQPAQPLEQVVYLGAAGRLGQQLGQQRLRRQAHQGAPLQRGAVGGAGDLLHQLLQQRLDDVGRDLRPEVGRRALVVQIGHQRQGQGVAVGEIEDALDLVGGHMPPRQVGAALLRVEVAQGQDAHHLRPTGVGAPGQARRPPPGEDYQGVGGQLAQELLAQPAVDGRQHLVGIDEQHQPARRVGQMGDGVGLGRQAQGGGESAQEEVGRGVDAPAIEESHPRPGRLGEVGELAHEARLADAAGAKEVEDEEGQFRPGQRLAQQIALGFAADEAPAPRLFQSFLQRTRHSRLGRGESADFADYAD